VQCEHNHALNALGINNIDAKTTWLNRHVGSATELVAADQGSHARTGHLVERLLIDQQKLLAMYKLLLLRLVALSFTML